MKLVSQGWNNLLVAEQWSSLTSCIESSTNFISAGWSYEMDNWHRPQLTMNNELSLTSHFSRCKLSKQLISQKFDRFGHNIILMQPLDFWCRKLIAPAMESSIVMFRRDDLASALDKVHLVTFCRRRLQWTAFELTSSVSNSFSMPEVTNRTEVNNTRWYTNSIPKSAAKSILLFKESIEENTPTPDRTFEVSSSLAEKSSFSSLSSWPFIDASRLCWLIGSEDNSTRPSDGV